MEKKQTEKKFISEVMSLFESTKSEITTRNQKISRNDSYIYGDEISKRLDIPVGHDFTPINWLRRAVEIHRSQFMGKGFSFDSSYDAIDIKSDDEKEKARLILENDKKKSYAEARRDLCEAINRDNGGDAFWSSAAENASAVGDTVIKAWYDEEEKKYTIQQVESIENIYVLWSRDDYRKYDAVAYVEQISLQNAVKLYGVSTTVAKSTAGAPFIPLSGATSSTISSQELVTKLEFTGILQGYTTDGNSIIECEIGKEEPMNVIIVGDEVFQIIKGKKMPKYYVLPNKRARRRPWGIPDITETAIQINLTYIEALSDWRTVSSKVNFPKFKAYGFPYGVQPPKPKARTVEFLPLAEGQDIIPITMGQSAGIAEVDFLKQLNEMENQFVREVGISRTLFDMPDANGNSNPAMLTAMKSVSDITNAKREVWEVIIRQIFEDALKTVAEYDDNVKEIISDDDWHIKISFPSALNTDDPTYNSTQLNLFNTGVLSVQTLLENLGYDKQEIDRIRADMEDPLTAAIHGHVLNTMAMNKIAPPGPQEPRISVNLRGDLTPEQEANLAYQKGMNQGPFGTTAGPQGNAGLTAQANQDNARYIEGGNPTGGTSISRNPDGSLANESGAGVVPPQQPELINGATANQQGVGIMSQPGSGAPMTSAGGKLAQVAQRQGK